MTNILDIEGFIDLSKVDDVMKKILKLPKDEHHIINIGAMQGISLDAAVALFGYLRRYQDDMSIVGNNGDTPIIGSEEIYSFLLNWGFDEALGLVRTPIDTKDVVYVHKRADGTLNSHTRVNMDFIPKEFRFRNGVYAGNSGVFGSSRGRMFLMGLESLEHGDVTSYLQNRIDYELLSSVFKDVSPEEIYRAVASVSPSNGEEGVLDFSYFTPNLCVHNDYLLNPNTKHSLPVYPSEEVGRLKINGLEPIIVKHNTGKKRMSVVDGLSAGENFFANSIANRSDHGLFVVMNAAFAVWGGILDVRSHDIKMSATAYEHSRKEYAVQLETTDIEFPGTLVSVSIPLRKS